ncbi:MAG: hypothetical protein C5B49_09755 [Bdellovibrio sp.]|nr:MAG: hypothetical protein C5B49_09755 [Bdellovibrio sp.]
MSRLLRLSPNFAPAFDGKKIALQLVEKLATQLKVEQAYLFGSASEGRNTVDSDLDLLVVIPRGADQLKYFAVVNQPFFSAVAVDWIFKTKSEFENQERDGGISRIAKLEGLLIYPHDTK